MYHFKWLSGNLFYQLSKLPDNDGPVWVFRSWCQQQKCKNVKHWFSGKDIDGTTKCEKQGRPRTLKPLDEFFLTLCRLRQGLGELHLAQLFIAWVSGVSGGKGGREKWKRERAKGEKCPTDAFTGAFHPHTARLNTIQSQSLLVIGLLASCFK